MCIVLITTAHPSYALIVLDNRDEFIRRPTSRPHWWSSHNQDILSARDLQREEQGTWLGVTKTGKFAVLTNFREKNSHDAQGQRSRGGMVTAWLTSPPHESTIEFIETLFNGEGVKGVGGFSLICGTLRKRVDEGNQGLQPLAIISNRCEDSEDVPWIAQKRNEVYGLSNTSFNDPAVWPKVEMGKKLLKNIVNEALARGWTEEQLVEELFGLLSTDTLPARNGETFEQYTSHLKESIFIPPIGQEETIKPLPKAEEIAAASKESSSSQINGHVQHNKNSKDELKQTNKPEPETGIGMNGCYGTQRQTVILVDWNGNVSFRERALWDADGRPVIHGEGDMRFEFKVEGWVDRVNRSYLML